MIVVHAAVAREVAHVNGGAGPTRGRGHAQGHVTATAEGVGGENPPTCTT